MNLLIKSALFGLLTLSLGCEFDIPAFSGSASNSNTDSLAFEMLNLQYIKGGAEEILHLENFKEITKTKVDGGYSYYVSYELVFNISAKKLLEQLNSRSPYSTKHDTDVDKLVHQFGQFKQGSRMRVSEQIAVVRGLHGLELQRY